MNAILMILARPLVIGTILAALLGGVMLWGKHRESVGYDKAKTEYTVAALAAEQSNRAKEQALQAQLDKAIQDAKIRQAKLAADAARSRADSDRLRGDLTAIRGQLSSLTRDAINRYSDTASVVLGECIKEYSGLAEAADRLDSERKTLIEAWPK